MSVVTVAEQTPFGTVHHVDLVHLTTLIALGVYFLCALILPTSYALIANTGKSMGLKVSASRCSLFGIQLSKSGTMHDDNIVGMALSSWCTAVRTSLCDCPTTAPTIFQCKAVVKRALDVSQLSGGCWKSAVWYLRETGEFYWFHLEIPPYP